MGDTAGIDVSSDQRILKIHFLAEYLNKAHILTCIVKHLNSN